MDKDKKQIKDSFDDFLDDVNPPNLWESIDESLEKDAILTDAELIEQSYMDYFDGEPSEKIWEAVEEELNFDLVWWRMMPVLNRMKLHYLWTKRLRLGFSFLAIYFFTHSCFYPSYGDLNENRKLLVLNEKAVSVDALYEEEELSDEKYFEIGDDNQAVSQQQLSEKQVSESSKTKSVDEIEAEHQKEPFFENIIANENIETAKFDQNIVITEEKDEEKTAIVNSDLYTKEFDLPNALLTLYPDAILNDSEHELAAELFEEQEKEVSAKASKFEIGGVVTLGSSLFLNYETKRALNPRTTQETALMLSYSGGLTLHYLMDKKNQIGTEIYFLEHSAQRYFNYSRTGNYLNRVVSMNYGKLNVFYQHNIFTNGQSSLNLKTGIYGAFLYAEEESINRWTELNHTQFYKRFDLGGNLALGQSHTFGKLNLSYGLFSELSFLNVFNGDNREPAHFKRTHILDFGTYVSLRYRL